ncbi:hypothetical protein D3C78_1409250 [compost metagenome]
MRLGLFDTIDHHLAVLVVFKHALGLPQGQQDLVIAAVTSEHYTRTVGAGPQLQLFDELLDTDRAGIQRHVVSSVMVGERLQFIVEVFGRFGDVVQVLHPVVHRLQQPSERLQLDGIGIHLNLVA